nr:glycoside hydrolase family 20 zincin-like fold domain-containing protein [uncultured Pedobacter sp.]
MIKPRQISCLFFTIFLTLAFSSNAQQVKSNSQVYISVDKNASERVAFGVERLNKALTAHNYVLSKTSGKNTLQIAVSNRFDSNLPKEGYQITKTNSTINIKAHDDSGVLYACLDLADRINSIGKIPEQLSVTDHPEMVLRGTCIGIQKPTLLPGRGTYEYPYTPETFPWLYDKDLWIKYLDMMVENRYNSLYLWNGHPFSSLVKLKDYPEALEVDEATFKKNEDIYNFITHEADKRGIWVIQMFYNVIIPKPFAEKRGLATQDRNRPIVPVIADYTRKSIAAFVAKYPNVGLLVTLGEAMEGTGQMDIDWFTQTILPGVKDGLKALGKTDEPPVVLRAHDTDAPAVMKAALPIYKNLYTMAKYNGEALTTYTPRGKWAELHRTLSSIGTVQIENVHILANLEPFRYSSPDFIQKSVNAMHSIYHANGLHLYPQASYWDWPYTADKADKRILEVDRDWMWYKAWARYAWKADRPKSEENLYWGKLLSQTFGANQKASENILKAYEESGEISPKILRRVGITDGNRQTMTLGMLMTQFINPFRYGLFTLMYESEAPEGEMIIDYAKKEWNKEPHVGETPIQIANEIEQHGAIAVKAINTAADGVSKNSEEFARLKNDIYCYDAMARFYASKIRAAVQVLRFKYSDDIDDLERAVPMLEQSVKDYAELTNLTKDTYLYANSMQTKQRKIPMRGVDATFIHWKEMLPVYQKELDNFKKHIAGLRAQNKGDKVKTEALKNADVKFLSKDLMVYDLVEGAKIRKGETSFIKDLAPELKGLKAIRFSKSDQIMYGTQLSFENSKPVKVLVGYFKDPQSGELTPPTLETDASANDFGQAEIKIANAIKTSSGRLINVHTYSFPKGKNTLSLGKGAVLVLGFINDDEALRIHNAGFDGSGKDIDWLFE